MKALQLVDKEQLKIVDMADPEIDANEVLLKIKKVGICGTDLHLFHGGMKVEYPLVMGHEFVGEIVKVGAGVQSLKVGDKATAEHVIGCGVCEFCNQGRKNLCINPSVIGLHRQGALAEYLAVPESLVYKLPSRMTYDQGVLVEPLSIAVYGVRKAQVLVGDCVAVIGQGPIGLLTDLVARAAGVRVYGFDILPHRLNFALKHHMLDGAINSKEPSALEKFRQAARQDGADVVFEVVGQEATLRNALQVVRPGGIVAVLGVFEHDVLVNMMSVVKREIKILGSWTCLNTFQAAIDLLVSDEIPTDLLITHRYAFADAAKAFSDASSYSEDRIKTIIEFD